MLGGYFRSRKSKPSRRKISRRKASSPKEPRVFPSKRTRSEQKALEEYMDDFMYRNQSSPPRISIDTRDDFMGGKRRSKLGKNKRR